MTAPPRVALVGCGAWGINLARTLHRLGALALVVDANEERRMAAQGVAGGVPVSATLSAAWADDIAAVAIATPAETHYALAREALAHGKDVFVEKPMALSSAHAEALCAAADEASRILMVGHVLEYHPAIVALRGLCAAGTLGELYYLYAHRLNLGRVRREENALWSFAPHDIAVILRLVGDQPSAVTASGAAYLQPTIADVTVTHLDFPRGVQAHIFVSWLHPFKEQRLVVVGSRRMVVFDDVHKTLVCYDRRVEVQHPAPLAVHGAGEAIAFSADEPLVREMQALLQAIATRRPPLTDGASGAATLRVLERAHAAMQAAPS